MKQACSVCFICDLCQVTHGPLMTFLTTVMLDRSDPSLDTQIVFGKQNHLAFFFFQIE